MTTSYLDRGPGRIAYDVEGAGPLIVCVPGMGDLRSVFRFLVPDLVAAGYRVATMDLRGHGDSDDGFDAYDDVAAGTDVLALIAELGGPALLLGNSMGAGASVWAAAEDPAAVTGLGLFGPFVRNPKVNPVVQVLYRALLVRPWGRAAWHTYYRRSYPGRPPADLAAHQDRIRASMRRADHWRSFVRTSRTSHAPAEARIGAVRGVPSLVVMGTRDQDWADATAEGTWVASALDAELLLVDGAGHYPMAEYPERVTPAVLGFAAQVHQRA